MYERTVSPKKLERGGNECPLRVKWAKGETKSKLVLKKGNGACHNRGDQRRMPKIGEKRGPLWLEIQEILRK